jgi:hypothetical protein
VVVVDELLVVVVDELLVVVVDGLLVVVVDGLEPESASRPDWSKALVYGGLWTPRLLSSLLT